MRAQYPGKVPPGKHSHRQKKKRVVAVETLKVLDGLEEDGCAVNTATAT